jgi:hypothetical protein
MLAKDPAKSSPRIAKTIRFLLVKIILRGLFKRFALLFNLIARIIER